jgi:hypothetical protein
VNKEMPGHTDTLNMATNQMTDTNKHALHIQMKITAVIMTIQREDPNTGGRMMLKVL